MSDDRKILSVKFNQDHECFTCSMESGVRIYNVEPLVEKAHFDIETVGSISQCEMLFRTNILAMVAGGLRPKFFDNDLRIYDDVKKKFVLDIYFPSAIKAVRMTNNRIVVACLTQIHVFSFPTPTERLFTLETRENLRGLCEITPLISGEQQILVFPGHKIGSVQLVDLSCNEIGVSSAPVWIQAHKSEIGCLALNQQGTLLATASQQGTLIRVWDTISKHLLVELRRGSDPATIQCINFSRDSEYLCCSSDKGTVHIFAVKKTTLNRRMSLASGILGKYGESQWALTNFTVPPESACICAFGPGNTIYAICLDGTFHKYKFTDEGNCSREAFDIFLDVGDDDEEDFM
ncbi:WD repeat domain phosphoinositide-interacting protein 4-like [Diorhabda carinulata]|uniref:WD repeat domain phosphoinositide-interacting protein 4-like n=1 Tax=Diorhabda sublineata TaxID=1163346 RepID=UPI0024E16803|nr:WD repeat domain phosphoinositide-interacting protein 4-like [Diorhabda sublineata]XP_057661238.1 WD repeat domain phosphoinositide-interacting protein 4-like [Diorhabda carinulata]